MHNDFIKGRRFGRNGMIAKQSQILMGFAQKYYSQGSFHLIPPQYVFFPLLFHLRPRSMGSFLPLYVYSWIKYHILNSQGPSGAAASIAGDGEEEINRKSGINREVIFIVFCLVKLWAHDLWREGLQEY